VTISAKIIADSISPAGKRLTTMELRYPRFIHAEFMTHRVFSRNASSSRAIPVERMIQDIIDDPAMPIHWGKNQSGMQAREEHSALIQFGSEMVDTGIGVMEVFTYLTHETAWLRGRDQTIELARAFADAGYHKQIVNRLLEPWLHINVVVTATEWDNFFTLRLHPDAQPEIHELARQMKQAMDASTPTLLGPGQWHLPYVDAQIEDDGSQSYRLHHGELGVQFIELEQAKVISDACCASVSYKTVDGQPMTLERAQSIYDKLVKADVFHASPFEHQATPDTHNRELFDRWGEHDGWDWQKPALHGNFTGWIQNRKLMETRSAR
jgi:hypothetical protein